MMCRVYREEIDKMHGKNKAFLEWLIDGGKTGRSIFTS